MESTPNQAQENHTHPPKKKKESGLKWLLLGGCITSLLVLCIGGLFGLVFFQTRTSAASNQPAAHANTLAPVVFEITNTPLSTEDLLNKPTATIDPAEPTITAKPFPTSPPIPPTTDIPVPPMGFEYGAISLHASNPKNFVAAAGRPQLVELLAFW